MQGVETLLRSAAGSGSKVPPATALSAPLRRVWPNLIYLLSFYRSPCKRAQGGTCGTGRRRCAWWGRSASPKSPGCCSQPARRRGHGSHSKPTVVFRTNLLILLIWYFYRISLPALPPDALERKDQGRSQKKNYNKLKFALPGTKWPACTRLLSFLEGKAGSVRGVVVVWQYAGKMSCSTKI
jgi:hypothetical protein